MPYRNCRHCAGKGEGYSEVWKNTYTCPWCEGSGQEYYEERSSSSGTSPQSGGAGCAQIAGVVLLLAACLAISRAIDFGVSVYERLPPVKRAAEAAATGESAASTQRVVARTQSAEATETREYLIENAIYVTVTSEVEYALFDYVPADLGEEWQAIQEGSPLFRFDIENSDWAERDVRVKFKLQHRIKRWSCYRSGCVEAWSGWGWIYLEWTGTVPPYSVMTEEVILETRRSWHWPAWVTDPIEFRTPEVGDILVD